MGDIDDSPRPARMGGILFALAGLRTNRGGGWGGGIGARATYVLRTAKRRYRNAHIRDLPSRLRQTLPRATDRPLSLKYAPATMPKTKEKDDMGRSADVLLAMQWGGERRNRPRKSSGAGGIRAKGIRAIRSTPRVGAYGRGVIIII